MRENNDTSYSVLEVKATLASFVKYLFSKTIIIGLTVIVFGLLGVWYAWAQKPIYKASLSFVTDVEGSSSLGTYAGIAAQFGLDIGGGSNNAFEGDNLIELLKSRTLIERTLLTPFQKGSPSLLIDYYITSNRMNKDWGKDKQLRNLKFTSDPNAPVQRARDSILLAVYKQIIKGQLDIGKRDKKLDLIDIQMSNTDELFAKRFVEMLADNAIQFYTDYKIKRARQNVEILQRQTDSVRGTLFGSITGLALQTDLNVNPIRQAVRTGSQRKQVDVQVNAKLYEELLKNLELSKLTLRKQTPLIQIIDTPKFPLEKKKMGRLLGGLLFGFIGGFLIVAYFITKYWMRSMEAKKEYETSTSSQLAHP
jgi:hypothetical protein